MATDPLDIPPTDSPPEVVPAPPPPARSWWGLIEDLPYAAIIVLTLIGVSWESIAAAPKTTYWEYVTPLDRRHLHRRGMASHAQRRADRHGRDPGPAMGGGADRDVSDQ